MAYLRKNLKQNKELWDLFTRKEETSSKQLDIHDRFINTSINPQKILEPSVSKFLMANGLKVEYPDGKKFAICLTHDIDDIYPPLSHTILSAASCIKNLNFNELTNQLLWRFSDKKNSPYWNFREIMKLEQKYTAKSSFYFLASERDIKRFRYKIEDLENELGFINDNGWELGLHCGYYAYNNLNELKKEKLKLEKISGKKVIGCRNHFLRFEVPHTWELLAKAGFKYDTTLGYSDRVGFRNGMCHPFKPFNLIMNKEIDILEISLNVMDVALFNHVKSFNEAWEITKSLIDTIEQYNGVLTLLWHNRAFNNPCRMEWEKLYEKILDYSYKKDAWLTSAEEIWKWWNYEI